MNTKPGFRTTEFWIGLLIALSPAMAIACEALFGMFELSYPQAVMFLGAAVAAFKYIGARTALKKNGGSQ